MPLQGGVEMPSINYNPRDYVMDFSWIGDIGKSIAGVASTMPELIKMNREVHNNNKFKQESYGYLDQWINQMDDGTAVELAASWGLGASDAAEAKAKIKEKIPQPLDMESETNQDYAKRLTYDFSAPLYENYKKTPKYSEGGFTGLFNNMLGRVGYESQNIPSYQRDMQADVAKKQEAEKFELDKSREAEKYGLDLERKQAEGVTSGSAISDMVKNSAESFDVYTNEKFDNYTADDKLNAFKTIREKEQDALRQQLKVIDETIKGANSGKNKIISFDTVTRLLNGVEDKLMTNASKIASINGNEHIDKEFKKILINQLKRVNEEFTARKEALNKLETSTAEEGGVTVEAFNKAMGESISQVNRERGEIEQAIIDQSKQNKKIWYRPGTWWGRGDDLERAKKAYEEMIGPVQEDANGEIVPRYNKGDGGVDKPETGGRNITLTKPGQSNEVGSKNNPIKANKNTKINDIKVGQYFIVDEPSNKYYGQLMVKTDNAGGAQVVKLR